MKYKNVIGSDGKTHLRKSDNDPVCLCGHVVAGVPQTLVKQLPSSCSKCKKLAQEGE
jgi:hypothetical protein